MCVCTGVCACVVLIQGLPWRKEKINCLLQKYQCCKEKLTNGEEIMVQNTVRETEKKKAQNKFEKLWMKGHVNVFESHKNPVHYLV